MITDPDHRTTIDTPHRDLRYALKRAYALTWGQRGIALLLMFVIAALLGPRDFGTAVMAVAYIVLIETIVGRGVAPAIIRPRRLPARRLDSIFWMLLAASAGLAALGAALAPLWAAANRLPELAAVITVLSVTIPLKGAAVVPHALLLRAMNFRVVALSMTVSAISGGAVGIATALGGAGVWALVAQQIVTSAVTAALLWRAVDWRPRRRFGLSEVRSRLRFGSGAFPSKLGPCVASQADTLVMGLLFGPLAVGLYHLADRLVTALLEVVTRSIPVVALPPFARLRDDPPRRRETVLSCIRLSATITMPAMALLAVAGGPLLGVLGLRWLPAAPALAVLAVIGMVKGITLPAGPLLLAVNRPRTVIARVWSAGVLTVAALLAVGLPMRDADAPAQILAAAMAGTAVVVVFGIVDVVITMRHCGIAVGAFGRAVLPGTTAAAAIVSVAAVLVQVGLPEAPVTRLLAVGGAGVTVAAVAVAVLEPTLRRVLAQRLRSAGAMPGAPP